MGERSLYELIKKELVSEKHQYLQTKHDDTTKNSLYSLSMRKEGNELYKKSNMDDRKMEEIFKLYTRSIALAPPDSDALALAYGNRSAILSRMKKYKECILDINRALQIKANHDAAFREKLSCRKAKSLVALESPDAEKVLDESALLPKTYNQGSSTDSNNLKKNNRLFMLNKSNLQEPEHMKIFSEKVTEIPSNLVGLQNKENIGKYLVATQDIKPGEIIFIDKPYVRCINIDNSHIYCGHCLIKSYGNIPCNNCNWCMFCSDECQKLALKNYHDIECTAVSRLIDYNSITFHDQLCLRSLIMGIKESGNATNFKDDLQSCNKYIEFKTTYTLTSDVPQKCVTEYIKRISLILYILCEHTSLFGKYIKMEDCKDISEPEDVLFTGVELLKLYTRIRTDRNIHIFQNTKYRCKFFNDISTCRRKYCCTREAVLLPILSFIQNSCNPNIEKCMTHDEKLIVYSLQTIKKDSPLFMAYHSTFLEANKQVRINVNPRNINLICDCNTCDCEACIGNWPTIAELYKMPKENPFLYVKTYNKKESALFDENEAVVKPIINRNKNFQFNQTTIRELAKAMEKATKHLKQPSIVICELMICLEIVFEKLYSLESFR